MSEIINVSFYVPDEIKSKVATGTYKIYGGLVRDSQSKAIVKHLVPINLDSTEVQSLLGINSGVSAALPLIGVGIFAMTAYMAFQTKKVMDKIEILEQKLDCIGKDVAIIKILSEGHLFARLRTAFEVQNMRLSGVSDCDEKKRLLAENADAYQKIKNEFLEILLRLSQVINIWDEEEVKQFYYYVWCYLLACEGYFKSLMEQGELQQAKMFFENVFCDGNISVYKDFCNRVNADKKLCGLGYSKELCDVKIMLEKSRDILFTRKELVNLMIDRGYSIGEFKQKFQDEQFCNSNIVCIG